MDWYTVDTAEEQERLVAAWADAPIENAELCSSLLEVARGQVVAYAPAPAPAEGTWVGGLYVVAEQPTPTRYVYAQLQQAINLWNAGRVASDGSVGVDGFVFTPRPLDKTIKTIIRPTDGKPDVL